MIHCPPHLRTRPTQARLRQALFNSLQTLVVDSRVLDLFSGSGTLGFEALSRGAAQVTFVELDRTAIKLAEKNALELKVLERVQLVNESVERSIHRISMPFDLVLADPPYAEGWEEKLLKELPWAELLARGGRFCLEWGKLKSQNFREGELPERFPFLVKVREKTYGDSVLTTYERTDE